MKKTISGIRGVFGEDLNLKDVLGFCNNFSSLIESGKCVMGMDTRPTGRMLKDTASAALIKNGIDVFNLDTVPTPVVFRESRNFGAGLVITSSHNPLEWNGMKFIINGRGINEQELAQIIQHREVPKTRTGSEIDISTSYIEDAKKIIPVLKDRPRVTVDLGGGAAGGFAPELLKEIGCDVRVINESIATCSRGPDPTSDDLSELVTATGKKGIGFAFDLDGDRLVVVKDGKKQTPDVTLGLGIARSLELGYKNFVLSIDTSVSIERYIRERGGTVRTSKVGEANVIDVMLKNGAQAGGEGSSGGFILPEFNYCREGILASGLIASMLETGEFAEILNHMENFHQIRERIRVDSDLHDEVIEKVGTRISRDYSETITMDGVKGVIDEDSWVLIRKSNTEDIIRVSAESRDVERCKRIAKETLELVNRCYEEIRRE